MNMIYRQWICLLALLIGLALPLSSASACPGCRDALATSKNGNATPWDADQDSDGLAYSKSVLFMLAMPFLLMSCFGFAFYRMTRTGTAQSKTATHPAPQAAAPELGLS